MGWIEHISDAISYIENNIRQRRPTLAGSELVSIDNKIIDIALKYGYDSPDSFTRSFTRFHGATHTAVRKEGAVIKSFASLKIKLTLEGGYIMDYKIIEKEEFTVFHYKGKMPKSLQDVNTKIFSEWLPNCKEYQSLHFL